MEVNMTPKKVSVPFLSTKAAQRFCWKPEKDWQNFVL